MLYCNQLTIPRFFRLSGGASQRSILSAICEGFYLKDSGEGMMLQKYVEDLRSPDAPEERWEQGVTIYYNPYAGVPLTPMALPCTSYFHMDMEEAIITREVIGCHTLTSFMQIGV